MEYEAIDIHIPNSRSSRLIETTVIWIITTLGTMDGWCRHFNKAFRDFNASKSDDQSSPGHLWHLTNYS